jgi:hypothetical protein
MSVPPLTDVTTIIGVESLFHSGPTDLRSVELAAKLTDLFIYNDRIRYVFPYLSATAAAQGGILPQLLSALMSRDGDVFEEAKCIVSEQTHVPPVSVSPCFSAFAAWARNNRQELRTWTALYREPWISGRLGTLGPDPKQPRTRFVMKYLFPVEDVTQTPEFNSLVEFLGVPAEDLLFAFDVTLRYPLYAELAGANAYYLSHPIREDQNPPTLTRSESSPPQIALPLGRAIARLAPHLTLDEFSILLHEARGLLRDKGIVGLKAGAVDTEARREVAACLGLPPRLKANKELVALLAAGMTGLSLFPVLGPASVLLGMGVEIGSLFWDGNVPRAAGKVKWLRWALAWDIERNQAVE